MEFVRARLRSPPKAFEIFAVFYPPRRAAHISKGFLIYHLEMAGEGGRAGIS
jgi:hypothetical protein